MPREFTRPAEGFDFTFGGQKTNERADILPPSKYPLAINVRQYSLGQVRTRPGLTTLFNGGPNRATDLRAYDVIQTDNLPRLLMRDSIDRIWLDTGVQVGSLAGNGSTLGAVFIPFRPNQSPNPYMYIANGIDYQKFSSPNLSNAVTQQKVGIAEPQAPPDAGISQFTVGLFNNTPSFTPGGTAGAVTTGNRVVETVTTRLQDPVLHQTSCQVQSASNYQIGTAAIFGFAGIGTTVESTILDVFTANPTPINISGIYYFSPTNTGRCVIVSSFLGKGPGLGTSPIGAPLLLSSLRRGALIFINGSETCYVWSVTEGPDGSVCIETSTVATWTNANSFTILPAVLTNVIASGGHAINSITDGQFVSTVTAGIGTLTMTATNNPFVNANLPFRPDDYITFGIKIDTLANLTEAKLLIDVGDGSFTQNFYYYTIRPADITQAILNTATQLAAAQTVAQRALVDEIAAIEANEGGVTFSGAQTQPGSGQWTQLMFPITDLTRVGSDQTKSLQTITKVQVLINASASVNVTIDAPVTVGGFSPDVGAIGSPYYYRVRPRSSVTGAVGNPSPATRYGTNPRRASVQVLLAGTYPDPQMDTWDVYRFGGSVTSYRFIGQAPIGATQFVDVYDDDAANAGDALDFDNFEPWPSVDFPLNDTFTTVVGTTATYVRTIASTTPTQLARFLAYLPGTLVRIGGQNVYTLWVRPQLVSSAGGNYTILFQFLECVGTTGSFAFQIEEPLLANQMLPYMWGPDANGTIFAVGDPLRPGTLYFSKSNNPDSAPDSYNQEIIQPAEPLLGGEIIDGLSFVGSSVQWWALYPTPDNPRQRYSAVKQPLTRGLAAPLGHCNDGVSLYWWADDGIYSSQDGSLTDADLYTLFPHEGAKPEPYVYNGITIYPPDYAQAARFRLAWSNGYLYATYPYVGGAGQFSPVLVCNLRTKAWSVDVYGGTNGINAVYKIEQPPQSQGVLNPVVLMAGTQAGGVSSNAARIYVQTDLANDNGVPITGFLSTFEFDGGDKRAPKQWGDIFLDCKPAAPAGIVVTPMSMGAGIAAPQIIPTSPNRTRIPVSVGGIIVSDFLGLYATWVDDFTQQQVGTHFYLWQPSYVIQPANEISWTAFGTAFGMKGYLHLRQIDLAWVSTAPITIAYTVFDGQAPLPIVVPSSGGVYQKALFPFSANKGLLYSVSVSSSAKFQIFNDDSELYVGQWNRQDPYTVFRGFGGRTTDDAAI